MDESARSAPTAEVTAVTIPPAAHWIFRPRQSLLLPPGATSPLMLLWVWLLPQALLLFLNVQAWSLAVGEMDPGNRTAAHSLFALELALLLGGAAFLVERSVRRRQIPRLAGLVFVLATSIFLAVVLLAGESAIPRSLRQWILPPDQWLYKQFALVAPGALYGAFRLLCPDRESNYLGGVAVSIAAFVSPFVFILLAIGSGAMQGLLGINSHILPYLGIPLYLTASTLAMGAVLRVCVSIYVAVRKAAPLALIGVSALIALVLPLGGLALNARIPFPVDFQIPTIYALAVINGLVLMLPNLAHPLAHRLVWLAQGVCFPFTAYFFAVFLPVQPLMPLATIFLGLGLLMAVPSALFLLHGYRILDGARAEMRDGPRWRPVVLALAAIALGPAFLTATILRDRHALHQALDYLQYPDYSANRSYPGDRAALRTALLNLRDFKEGYYLPFYSEFYNWLAFDNLLLPQAKLAETYQAFFGEPLPKPTARPSMQAPFLDFGRRPARTAQEVLTGPAGRAPAADAVAESLRTQITTAPGEVRALAQLTVRNSTASATEYRTTFRVPAGVTITGMWLTIGAERVPARLFEERAALWVYQKITEATVPQDPAILRYVGPDTVELRVFPVDPHATRFVEIAFAYPDNLAPAITIAERSLELPPARSTAMVAGAGVAWIPSAALAAIPQLHRVPTPHLVIDTSRDSALRDSATLAKALRSALDAFPTAPSARITFANFDTRDFRNGAAIPVAELRDTLPATLLKEAGPFEGGLLAGPAIKEILVRQSQLPLAEAATSFPAVVLLRGSVGSLADDSLAAFAALLPDQPAVWRLDSGAKTPTLQPLDPALAANSVRPVHLLQRDGRRTAVVADAPAFLVANTADNSGPITIYDSSRRDFVPLAAAEAAPADLAAASPAWTLAQERIFAPAQAGADALGRLLALAREASILAPSTALMVVENSAQWKMLAMTEKKTLKGHESLALRETPSATPEPGTLALLGLAALLAIGARFRSRRPQSV
jgi:hypothetical protein